ncbi:hypothetical protein, partial [Burkholderia multivorans]|uniref:hypothetical protein n=1 Tax=Burkholderia multivorans TaxID=87883 RepID=UPI001C616225
MAALSSRLFFQGPFDPDDIPDVVGIFLAFSNAARIRIARVFYEAESIIKCNTPDLPCTRPCRRPMGTR